MSKQTPLSQAGLKAIQANLEGKQRRHICTQIFCFGVVGVIGFAVNAGIVEGLTRFIGPIWAQMPAFPVAASVTWWLNRRYTFGASRYIWHKEWLRYMASNSLGWCVNNGTYFILVVQYSLMYKQPALAVAAGSIVGMFFNFIASKKGVFSVKGSLS